MRAGIYLRISQDRTGEELGVDRQREQCRDLAARRGWDVVGEYVDNDVSAAGGKVRPAWENLMAAVEAGHIDVVIGWTIDRTLRSGRDRLRMLESGKEHGITISLVRGSDMDLATPSGRLAADILGAVALSEIEMKSDRQKAAHAQAAAQGRRVGGRRPFGYTQDGLKPLEPEAAAVRAAFHDYLAGTPLSVIARRWNEAGMTSGVPRKDGSPPHWEHTGVRHLLRNPRYMGIRRHQPKGEPPQDHPAAWPALVDEATWRAVNALLNATAATVKPHGGRQLLTGVIRCAVCDQQLVGGGAKVPGTPMYRCPSGSHVCRRAEPVENLVLLLVKARLAKGDIAAAITERNHSPNGYAAQAADIRAELDTIALERANRTITPRQFSLLNSGLLAQLAEVEQHLADAGRVDALAELLADPNPVARFEGLDRDQQRVVIGALMRIRLASAGRGRRDVVRNGLLVPRDPSTVLVEKLRTLDPG